MTLNQEEKDAAVLVLSNMLSLLGLAAEVAVADREEQTVVMVKSDSPGRLIGKRGRVIENLQYLLNRSLSQRFAGAVSVAIDVEDTGGGGGESAAAGGDDTDGAREPVMAKPSPVDSSPPPDDRPRPVAAGNARQGQLQQMAVDAAKEVRRWGGSKELGPFSRPELAVVQAALQGESAIEVADEAREDGRAIIVVRAVDHQG